MPEFYMILARKCLNFTLHLPEKNIFPAIWGGHICPLPIRLLHVCAHLTHLISTDIASSILRGSWMKHVCMLYAINRTVNDGVAHSKNPRKCAYHVTFDLDLDIEHTLDAGLPGDHRVQVWSRSGHLPGRRSDFHASTKVPVSRDLWPWPWPWAHPGCTLTWSPSCASLVAIRPFACEKKRFAQKFTDGRTDGQTTDAAPLH